MANLNIPLDLIRLYALKYLKRWYDEEPYNLKLHSVHQSDWQLSFNVLNSPYRNHKLFPPSPEEYAAALVLEALWEYEGALSESRKTNEQGAEEDKSQESPTIDELRDSLNQLIHALQAITNDESLSKYSKGLSPKVVARINAPGDSPWLIPHPEDRDPVRSWYIAARYFARVLVKESPNLLNNRQKLAEKTAKELFNRGIKNKGKEYLSGTIKNAFTGVKLDRPNQQ